ncbi:hypothetical protein [Novosphingobium sp. Leaf2]|uniref:hypothetical protein n=1 Tax=Novosphingobium sp. Leaf2 TaxID=1735670 RepID=UPI0006F7F43E|nr:hypothetical protein [Novosphingobium sp. Leaf2]KQM18406.1 hypothetical protein ASE49_09350 [Novosphingobium sp. Leaf2]
MTEARRQHVFGALRPMDPPVTLRGKYAAMRAEEARLAAEDGDASEPHPLFGVIIAAGLFGVLIIGVLAAAIMIGG